MPTSCTRYGSALLALVAKPLKGYVCVLGQDVLKVDWPQRAAVSGGPLSVIGNLPYNITSQILFSFIDSYKAVNKAVVTAQYEVRGVLSDCLWDMP